MVTERRTEERLDLEQEAHTLIEGREYAVRMTSLSKFGCCLSHVPDDLKPGDKVQIIFRPPGQRDDMCLTGAARWRDRGHAGIEFGDLTYTQEITLSSFIIRQPLWMRLMKGAARRDEARKQTA